MFLPVCKLTTLTQFASLYNYYVNALILLSFQDFNKSTFFPKYLELIWEPTFYVMVLTNAGTFWT